jgi:cobalt-zinc-cadmium efflux system outer membrane protein
MKRALAFVSVLGLLSGVALSQDRAGVSKKIEQRLGHGLGPEVGPAQATFPPGVSIVDGLSEDEAIATALWNNAAFQADLANLGIARADLVEAGLLRNPILSLLFPLGPKQLEFTVTWPLEVLWQRPRRVSAAKLNLEAVAENLVQHGLDLVRDVRLTFADLASAQEHARLAAEAMRLSTRLADLAQARLRAGDVSGLEASAARNEADRAEADVSRLAQDAAAAQFRLRYRLGFELQASPFEISLPSSDAPPEVGIVSELVKQALAARPDLRAAEITMEAAAQRAGWERSRWLSISAMFDANGEGKEGFESGPGVLAEIPIFNRNQGGRARADAEIKRAALQYVAVRHQIVQEVQTALTQFLQARSAFDAWSNRILPSLEEAVQRSEKAYAAGEVSYIFVLENARQLVDARLRKAEASADVRRGLAQLEHSTGKLGTAP